MKSLYTAITTMLFLLFLLAPDLVSQQEISAEKYSKVSITVQDKSDVIALQRLGFDMEGTKLNEHSLEIFLSESEISILKDSGFSFEILIDDMAKYYQERNSRTDSYIKNLEKEMKAKYNCSGFGFGSMGGFYTYDEVVAELDTMRMLYPNLITAKYSIGTTYEGRTIWATKISDNPDVSEPEPKILLNALTHATEVAGMMSVVYYMYYLLENYGSDPEITYLVDNREFYFVPVLNADGYVYNEQYWLNGNGFGGQRKNRHDDGSGCTGINIGVNNNCNYGYMWGYNNIGSSPYPCDPKYRGTAPFSEAENQAIRDICIQHNFSISNSYHSAWDVVFPPWAYNLTQTEDSLIFNTMIRLGTLFNNYQLGTPNLPNNYEVNGDVTDWMYGDVITKPRIFGVLTEVGTLDDGFWPPPERIFPLAEENVYLNVVLAWGPGIIDDPPYISEANIHPSTYLQQGDSILVTASEYNPQNYNSEVTAYVINYENVTVDEFQMTETTGNNYIGSRTVPVEENIYRILFKDIGVELPSNIYSKEDSRFTTAGPIVIDSLLITYNPIPKTFKVKPFVRNVGQTFTVGNLVLTMSTNDTTILYISGSVSIDSLHPGEVVLTSSSFTVKVDTNFSKPFRFNFAIKSDGWVFWRDSISIITSIEEEELQPLAFKLEQNYPNPFNPSTKIKYLVPQTSQVQIKIFDVLGTEIETLVNEEKPIGIYELTWYAEGLPSGVYFYQLRAGSLVETKKMVLMK